MAFAGIVSMDTGKEIVTSVMRKRENTKEIFLPIGESERGYL